MSPLNLFEGVGIELEYMIVDRDSLAVRPYSDRVLAAINGGEVTSEVDRGAISWSNELVAHVIELKTTRPVANIDDDLRRAFADDVRAIDALLEPHSARLLPTAMHPFMDPLKETVLWAHEYSPVYEAYDRIFGCKGHGWSNLQSMHLNYPFAGDEQFGKLHAAIRLLMPLIPAVAASSPVVEARLTGLEDNRLEFYRTNSKAVPSILGEVVPEPVFTRADYQRRIFEPMFEHIALLDPEGILRDEFLNARGAIARFGRGSIEIRVIDIQECPGADLILAGAVTAVLKLLVGEHLGREPIVGGSLVDLATQQAWEAGPLAEILVGTAHQGGDYVIRNRVLLEQLGVDENALKARDLWLHLLDRAKDAGSIHGSLHRQAQDWVRRGTLASRIRRAVGDAPAPERIAEVYRRLADDLTADRFFEP